MGRLLQFRAELMILWRAFVAAETPLWLKGLMLLVPAYLISPIDLLPDFIPDSTRGRALTDWDGSRPPTLMQGARWGTRSRRATRDTNPSVTRSVRYGPRSTRRRRE